MYMCATQYNVPVQYKMMKEFKFKYYLIHIVTLYARMDISFNFAMYLNATHITLRGLLEIL